MVRAYKKFVVLLFAAASLLTFSARASAQQEDPPARVARLNYINGNVSMEPAGSDDWAPAIVNRPFTTGDYLYTDNNSQAEMHMDIAAVRMGPLTSFGFLNLNDHSVQIKMSEGEMFFRLRNFAPDQVFEVDTPNAAVTLLRDGVYRFNVDPNGNTSFVVVREGSAEVTGGGQAFTLNPGNSATLSGTDQLSYDVEGAPGPDQFDNWCLQRDRHQMQSRTAHYLPPTVIGYEDLDDYGTWNTAPAYGAVWYPSRIDVGWSPYHYGHWAWIAPWGYTWVDSAPWGFAPFHYGRWAYIGNRWGWCPGPIVVQSGPVIVRPYYAPALVTFFGGAHFGVGISIGGGFGVGASLGWCPLGFGEIYAPPYRVSQGYFRNVNVYNTNIVKNVNITNVYNNVYVNKNTTIINNRQYANINAPGAFTAMPRGAFASGTPVNRAAFVVPPGQAERLAGTGAPVYGTPVAPTRQALAPSLAMARGPVARPPQQIMSRQVVARAVPPPPPPSFAASQSFLQQHTGEPLNNVAMRQEVTRSNPAPTARPAAFVRQAPAATAVQVHPGQRVGTPMAFGSTTAPRGPQNQPAPNGRGLVAQPAGSGRPMVQQPAANANATPNGFAPNNQMQRGPANVAQVPSQPNQHGLAPNQRAQQAAQPGSGGRPAFTPNQAQPRGVERVPPTETQPTPNARPAAVVPQPRVTPTETVRRNQVEPQNRPAPQVEREARPAPAVHAAPAPHAAPAAHAAPQAEPRSTPREHEAHGTPPNRPEEHRAPAPERKPAEHEKEEKPR